MIIPCYNAEEYIGRCLDSVLSQTYKNIELIVVNDGSRDNTWKIIESYKSKVKNSITKFVYIEQENQGVGAACNNAFKMATGEFLMLLDSDDFLLPNSIKMQCEWMERNCGYGAVRTNGYYVTEDNLEACDRLLEVNEYMKSKENIFDELFNGTTYLWPGTYMIRMKVLERLYPTREIYPSRNGQNLQFLMMASYISNVGFIDVPLMKYVLRKESLSHFSAGNVMKRELEAMDAYKDIRKHLVKQFMPKDAQKQWNDRIERLYANINLDISIKHKNKKFAKIYYANMRKRNMVTLDCQIKYYKLMNPFLYCCLRLIRKIRLNRS